MALRRQNGDRLSSEYLVKTTPIDAPLLGMRATMLTLLYFVIICLALYQLLLATRVQWWMMGMALMILVMMWSWSNARVSVVGRIERKWRLRQWRRFAGLVAAVGGQSTAGDVIPGQWICRREDYRQANSDYRARRGRSAPPMSATYRLLAATFREDGHRQVLSFFDGSVEKWHPRSVVFVHDDRLPEYLSNDFDAETISDSSRILTVLIRKLHVHPSRAESASSLVDLLGSHYDDMAVGLAIDAAVWWGLVVSDAIGQLELSDAGRVWFEADEAGVERAGGRSLVSERRRTEPTFHIGYNYGTINVGRTIRSRNTVESSKEFSDDDYLRALSAVLEADDIPWQSPKLSGVRSEIERAVAEKTPRTPGVKAAVARLLPVCGELALGVTGNAIYDTLKSLITG